MLITSSSTVTKPVRLVLCRHHMKPSRDEIEALIRARAAVYQLDADLLIRQCKAESEFDQDVRSTEGAIGLFQLMPATAAWPHVDAHDWRANVDGGVTLIDEDPADAVRRVRPGVGRLRLGQR
jgi:soluble lytic murein transglycosylase-like protein